MRIQDYLAVVLVCACTNSKSDSISGTTSAPAPEVKTNLCNLRVFSKEKLDIPIFAAVDSASPIATIPWNTPGTIFQVIEQGGKRLLGCQSSWVKLKVTMASEQTTQVGWLKQSDYCGNPLTNCP